MKHLSLILFSFFISVGCFSQNGKIRGAIFDEAGEPIIGASAVVVDKNVGASTDLDGNFTISVEEGTYALKIYFITYQTQIIEDVVVKNGEVTSLGEIILKEDNQELEEIVVTTKAKQASEMALLMMKKKSTTMLDGISAAKMKLTGDATAVEAAKRVTGVSIEGGKYVYIRGLGDRYSKTTLNGVDVPGLDPDKNTLQMDIFPTNLIDNIVVSKNFTADLPADFTGGLLNIETKDFPEEKFMTVSISTSYNPQYHFNSNFLTYKGGSTDFLGLDDGTRALPTRANASSIPTPFSGASPDEVNTFVRSFSPTLGAERQTSLMDLSLGFSSGNQINLKNGNTLGYVFSLSYKSDYKYYDEVSYGEYQRFIDPDKYEMRYATIQEGELAERNVLVGTLAGIAYKTKQSKLRLTAMHLQNGESRAGKFFIDNDGAAVGQSGYFAASDNLEYNQRGLTNVLLNGVHVFSDDKSWELDWRISPTLSSSVDPDIRKTAFTLENVDTLFQAGAGGNPARIWRYLNEVNATAKFDITKKYKLFKEDAKLKFGASHNYKARDYEILFFDLQFWGGQDWPNPDPSVVLDPENIYPNSPNSVYYQSGNNTPNPNAYSSNVNNTGVYVFNEFIPTKNLKANLGVRAENYVQRHTGRDQTYASGDTENGKNLVNEKVLDALDIFPSANLIYDLNENQKLRASYAKTIARPSFKELSFAQILDPITNRIFNGTLFTYTDWDGNLSETRIDNVDLRWELFLPKGQSVSVSAFYKAFDNPIELVRIPEQQTSTEFQPRNVGNGTLYGLEFDLTKNMSFISEKLEKLSFSGNLTLVKSIIDMTDVEFNSRKGYEKTGQTITDTREMAGQSPYVINTGFIYTEREKGLDVGLFYNMKGPTLQIVGAGLFPDVYMEPFHSVNLSFNKKLGEKQNTSIEFKVANLLNDKIESFYTSFQAEKQVFSSINPGMTFGVGLSHKF